MPNLAIERTSDESDWMHSSIKRAERLHRSSKNGNVLLSNNSSKLLRVSYGIFRIRLTAFLHATPNYSYEYPEGWRPMSCCCRHIRLLRKCAEVNPVVVRHDLTARVLAYRPMRHRWHRITTDCQPICLAVVIKLASRRDIEILSGTSLRPVHTFSQQHTVTPSFCVAEMCSVNLKIFNLPSFELPQHRGVWRYFVLL